MKKANKNKTQHIPPSDKPQKENVVKPIIIIIIATFIAFIPALNNDFTNWDDDIYVTGNPHITELSAQSIKGFFTRFQNANYHPLTFLSLAIDYHFSELNPALYHFTNILLHILNTLLVFLFVRMLFKKVNIAFIAAALFGVHTLHVESVAWVSERKDVLYTFFFMLSLCSYAHYAQKGNVKFYIFSLILFVLSCFSKGQAVSLAVTVILVDVFLKRKINTKLFLEKVPFFIVAIIFGIVAVKAQSSADAIFDNAASSYLDRVLFASYGFINYILKLVYPFKLSTLYPYPVKGDIGVEFWICLLLVVAIIYSVIRLYKTNYVYLFSFLFFAVNIFLVLQLIPVGNAIMADRYAYIPSIGFFVMVGWWYEEKIKKPQLKKMLGYFLIAYTGLLGILTFQRTQVWRSSLTLWEDTVKKYPEAEVAWNNLGSYYNNAYEYKKAISCYDEAIKINPLYADAIINRGMSKKNIGAYNEAVVDLDNALKIKPNSAFAYSTKGVALTYLNNLGGAYACFIQAMQLDSLSADAYSGMGVVKTRNNNVKGALYDFEKSLRIRPNHPETISNRGIAKAESGDLQGAIADFSTAINLKPKYSGAYLNRGLTYLKTNQIQTACDDFYKALQYGTPQAQAVIDQYCVKK